MDELLINLIRIVLYVKDRAEDSLSRLAELNPYVCVAVCTTKLTQHFIYKFRVVFTESPINQHLVV